MECRGALCVAAIAVLAAIVAAQVDDVVPEKDFVEPIKIASNKFGESPDELVYETIQSKIRKAILDTRSHAGQLTEVNAAAGSGEFQDLTKGAAATEEKIKEDHEEEEKKAAAVAAGSGTLSGHDLVHDMSNPSKHDPVDADIKKAFPLGVNVTVPDDTPPPFTWEDASLGKDGIYNLGGGRRRIGAGFGRRRRSTPPPTAAPTKEEHFFSAVGSGSGSGSAAGSAEEQLVADRFGARFGSDEMGGVHIP